MSDGDEKGTESGDDRRSRPESAAERRARRKAAANAAGGKASADKPAKGKPTAGKDTARKAKDTDDKRASLPARAMRYLREVVDELRKVIWPTRKQMITYTAVVIVFVIFMVALVAGLDWVFGKAVFALFG